MEKIKERKGLKIEGNRLYTPLTQPIQAETISSEMGKIRQGVVTNALYKSKSRPDNTIADLITGTATIRERGLEIRLQTANGKELNEPTKKLLDFFVQELTESGTKSPKVNSNIDAYMSKRGWVNRKEAYKQVRACLVTLGGVQVTWEQKEKDGVTRLYRFVNLADSGSLDSKGNIEFTFGATFFSVLKDYAIMRLHPLYWRLNAKYNPNSGYYLRKLHEHKNMNIGKDNEDTVAVETLLDASPETKTRMEVMAGNRNLTDRILDPFERDMDALDEALTWEYCHRNGAPLKDEELEIMDYSIFIKLNVKVFWRNYPDQTKRLEDKAERDRRRKRRATAKKSAIKRAAAKKKEAGA